VRGIRLATGTIVAAAALLAPASASAAPSVTNEFPLPAGATVGSNNEIVEGPDGNLWMTSDAMTPTLIKMTPDGTATAFTPGGMTQPASGITVGPDGNLWAAEATAVLKIDPANPNAAAQTSIGGLAGGQAITAGPDGNIWLAGTNGIVKIPPANPAGLTNNPVVLNGPKGMATGSDGLLWIADGPDIVSTTTAAPTTLTKYSVGGGTQDVAAGPNTQVGYANPVSSPQTVGLITPGGTPQPFTLQNTDPFGIAFGQDGAYWVARSQGNDLLRMTTDGQITFLGGFAPSGGVGPRKITTGPGNTLWVTLDTPEKVARVAGVEPPATDPGTGDPGTGDPGTGDPGTGAPTPPETVLGKTPKKKVKTSKRKVRVAFGFSSPTAGATFQCALTKKGKGARPKACASPARFKVKPGRYLFEVTASAGGLADGTPATRSLKVVRKD
jgi:hypothetical protein